MNNAMRGWKKKQSEKKRLLKYEERIFFSESLDKADSFGTLDPTPYLAIQQIRRENNIQMQHL